MIIGGADGATTIYLSGNPFMHFAIYAVISVLAIFAVGFACGYFFRARRSK